MDGKVEVVLDDLSGFCRGVGQMAGDLIRLKKQDTKQKEGSKSDDRMKKMGRKLHTRLAPAFFNPSWPSCKKLNARLLSPSGLWASSSEKSMVFPSKRGGVPVFNLPSAKFIERRD